MRFPRQKYWNVLPFPSPGDLPNLDQYIKVNFLSKCQFMINSVRPQTQPKAMVTVSRNVNWNKHVQKLDENFQQLASIHSFTTFLISYLYFCISHHISSCLTGRDFTILKFINSCNSMSLTPDWFKHRILKGSYQFLVISLADRSQGLITGGIQNSEWKRARRTSLLD